MNVYSILTDEIDYLEEYIDGYPRYERGQFFDYVAAETRGKGKYLFVREHHDDVEWTTPMSIRLVGQNIDVSAGILSDIPVQLRCEACNGEGMDTSDEQLQPCPKCMGLGINHECSVQP